MSSLAELPKVCGFFSYSREDDEDSKGTLSDLRDAIQRELSAQLGRNKRNFRLFQDREAIAAGKLWEKEIAQAIEEAAFFIPIITPRALGSWHCRFEFDSFLTRERELGRDDLVFPILYIAVPALQEEPKSDDEPVLSILRARQYVDWRALRHLPTDTPKVRETIAAFCSNIVETLRESRLTPEERQEKEALVVARRNVDEDRNHVETETSKHVEEEPPSKHEQGKEKY